MAQDSKIGVAGETCQWETAFVYIIYFLGRVMWVDGGDVWSWKCKLPWNKTALQQNDGYFLNLILSSHSSLFRFSLSAAAGQSAKKVSFSVVARFPVPWQLANGGRKDVTNLSWIISGLCLATVDGITSFSFTWLALFTFLFEKPRQHACRIQFAK